MTDERERLREALTPLRGYPVDDDDGFRRWERDENGAYVGFEDALDALAHDRPSEDEERRDAITQDRTWASGYAAGRAALSGSSDPEDTDDDLDNGHYSACPRCEHCACAGVTRKPGSSDPEAGGLCWFCKGEFVIDALIAGYDTWDEQRLACLACNERMQGNWRAALSPSESEETSYGLS